MGLFLAGIDMPGNKKPKKKYVKKPEVFQTPITIRFKKENEIELKLEPLLSVEDLIAGRGDHRKWNDLVIRLNMGQILAKTMFDEAVEPVSKALDIMVDLNNRNVGSPDSTFDVSNDEYTAIKSAVQLCNEMESLSTRRELRDAVKQVYKENDAYHKKVAKIRQRLATT